MTTLISTQEAQQDLQALKVGASPERYVTYNQDDHKICVTKTSDDTFTCADLTESVFQHGCTLEEASKFWSGETILNVSVYAAGFTEVKEYFQTKS